MARQHTGFRLAVGALIAALLTLSGGLLGWAQTPASPAALLLLAASLTSEQRQIAGALAGVLRDAAPPWLAIEAEAARDVPALEQAIGRAPLMILVQPCGAADCRLQLQYLPATPPARGLVTPALQQAILAADPPALAYMPGREAPAIDLAIGLAAYATDRCADALPYLDRAAEQTQPAATLAFYRARCRHAERDYAAAFDLLRAARPALLAAPAPRPLLALWDAAIADALAQDFAFDRALAWDGRAIHAAREGDRQLLAELHLLRGQHRLYLYEWDAALADYNTALRLLPGLPRAYYLRGLLHYTQNRRAAAYADLTRYLALETDPASPSLPLAHRYADELARLLATPAAQT